MDELRVLLLILGVIVVVVIYAVSRDAKASRQQHKRLQDFDDAPTDSSLNLSAARDQDYIDLPKISSNEAAEKNFSATPQSAAIRPANIQSELIVVLHVATIEPDARLNGYQIHAALEKAGFQFGAMDIYHYFESIENQRRVLFSAANMMKPGTLKPKEKEYLSTRGVSIFMRLPSLMKGEELLNRLFVITEVMAEVLNVAVLDENRSQLTNQTRQHLLDQVKAFERGPIPRRART